MMANATCRIARRPFEGRQGFTLVEALCSTVIVGLAAAAILVGTASSSRTNGAGQQLTEAVFIAQEFREWTLGLPFHDPDPGDAGNPPGPDGSDPHAFVDDLDDLMDVTYSPPRDGQGNAMSGMTGWSEQITLTWRDPADLSSVVSDGSSDVIYVAVNVLFDAKPVYQAGWLVTNCE
jgi:prepilin-type N-terminal cleavage/methylation domain-containing protein